MLRRHTKTANHVLRYILPLWIDTLYRVSAHSKESILCVFRLSNENQYLVMYQHMLMNGYINKNYSQKCYFRPFSKLKKPFSALIIQIWQPFILRNVPNLSKNRLIEWIDSSKKCIGTCIMGKFSKMNRFTVLESQNRLSTNLYLQAMFLSLNGFSWVIRFTGNL